MGRTVSSILKLLTFLIVQGDENLLPAVEVNYAAYTRWQRALQTSETIESQLQYWGEKLKGVEPLLLPSDRPRPVVQKYNGGMHTFNIPSDILKKLRHLSQQHGTTLFMTTLAAFQVLMAKLSGTSHFAIGSPASGRAHLSLERTLGYFVNPLAISADFSGDPNVSMLLDR